MLNLHKTDITKLCSGMLDITSTLTSIAHVKNYYYAQSEIIKVMETSTKAILKVNSMKLRNNISYIYCICMYNIHIQTHEGICWVIRNWTFIPYLTIIELIIYLEVFAEERTFPLVYIEKLVLALRFILSISIFYKFFC